MATQIYLGKPPAKIVEWIQANYKPDMTKVPLCFTAEEANSTITMSAVGSAPTVYLETSSTGDDGSWSDFTVGSTTITLANVGDKVYFRAKQDNNVFATGYSDYNKFVMTGKIAASGNINTLLKADGSIVDLSERIFCYARMFEGCSSLTQAPVLPATTLADSCYSSMFWGCTSLTKAPALPATTLAILCYENMFYNCTNIPEPKYNMSHMTFDEAANEIRNKFILGSDGTYEVQCSDKILVATYNDEYYYWTVVEKQ